MKTIAISGKGGTGKSTLSALIIRWLGDQGLGPILAVDADSNVNLNDLLGGGMTKQEFLEYKIHASLIETRNFDLVAMGRPEGPGCYCYANNLLREILKTLSENYQFVVIDNEAGMEHLSRRTVQNIDFLLVVSDPSPRGVQAAGKITRLLSELDTRVGETHLILNRVKGKISDKLQKTIEIEGLSFFSYLPEDGKLLQMDQAGVPVWKIDEDSPAYQGIQRLMTELLKRGKNGI
jgi:CO dehydrogenase maturation factor